MGLNVCLNVISGVCVGFMQLSNVGHFECVTESKGHLGPCSYVISMGKYI